MGSTPEAAETDADESRWQDMTGEACHEIARFERQGTIDLGGMIFPGHRDPVGDRIVLDALWRDSDAVDVSAEIPQQDLRRAERGFDVDAPGLLT